MTQKPQKQIILFNEKTVRRQWDEDKDFWHPMFLRIKQ